jgi:CPA1 family monovalent cation:H+ antiporter
MLTSMGIASLLSTITNEISFYTQVQLLVLLLAITLLVSLLSRRLRLPYTLVLVLVGLVIGFLPILSEVRLDPNVVLFLFLPALLFEGAWNIEIELLIADWLPTLLLAVPGLLLSIALVTAIVYWGVGLPLLVAVLLGAMISPTDPVAILSLLRQLGMSPRLRTIMEGESLFNDGVGAAVFDIILVILLPTLGLVAESNTPTFWNLAVEALWLMVGGLALGLSVGWVVTRLLHFVNDHLIEITVTFSVAYGIYLLAIAVHTSGLLAVVGAGLIIGSYGRRAGMSQRAREGADAVWEFSAYAANSLLFLLLGIQIGASSFALALPGIIWALIGVVAARLLMVYLFLPLHDAIANHSASRETKLMRILPRPRALPQSWRPLFALSGLRGALSIALVLSLPTDFPQKTLLANMVYGVVLVTLLGQGLGLRVLLPRWSKKEASTGT